MSRRTVLLRLLRVPIELAGVAGAGLDGGRVGRVDVLPGQPVPRDLREPRVVLDVLRLAVQVPQPLRQVRRDQPLEQVLRVRVDVRGVLDFSPQDVLVDLHRRPAVPEGRVAAQHFVDQDAQGPPFFLFPARRQQEFPTKPGLIWSRVTTYQSTDLL